MKRASNFGRAPVAPSDFSNLVKEGIVGLLGGPGYHARRSPFPLETFAHRSGEAEPREPFLRSLFGLQEAVKSECPQVVPVPVSRGGGK